MLTVWGRGMAAHFVRPFLSLVGSHIRGVATLSPKRTDEQGWWKWWLHGLGLGSPNGGNVRPGSDIPIR